MDIITDAIKSRVTGITGEAHKQFKGSNPYRQEPVSRKERLLHYADMTPEIEMSMRQEMGDAAVDNYILKMEALLRRGNGR